MNISDSAYKSEGGELISIIVPVMNEAGQIASLVESARRLFAPQSWNYEILFCDDGSSDRTWECIVDASSTDSHVHGVQLTRNFGKDLAILAGLKEAHGDAVVVMDGDGQHPLEFVPELVSMWREDIEIVEAVKTQRPDQGFVLRMASRAFNRLFTALAGVDLDNATDFRLLSRKVVDELTSMPERSVFFRGLSAWAGHKTVRVPFEPRSRGGDGRSRFTLWSLLRFAARSLVAFTSAPLQLVTATGLAFALFAIALGAHTLYQWISGAAVEGFTTVILLLLIMGSVIMIALGIIGLYLAQIHKEVKRRPRFVVARRTSGLQ